MSVISTILFKRLIIDLSNWSGLAEYTNNFWLCNLVNKKLKHSHPKVSVVLSCLKCYQMSIKAGPTWYQWVMFDTGQLPDGINFWPAVCAIEAAICVLRSLCSWLSKRVRISQNWIFGDIKRKFQDGVYSKRRNTFSLLSSFRRFIVSFYSSTNRGLPQNDKI